MRDSIFRLEDDDFLNSAEFYKPLDSSGGWIGDDRDSLFDTYRNISTDSTIVRRFLFWANCRDAAQVADLTTEGEQRAEMFYRIGNALEEKLADRAQARERFETALDLDPAHLPSLAALRTIAIDEADWDRAARYLEQEQLHTEAPRNRARLLVELGKLRDEMLNEHDLAIAAYELAIQCNEMGPRVLV